MSQDYTLIVVTHRLKSVILSVICNLFVLGIRIIVILAVRPFYQRLLEVVLNI